MQTLYRRPLPDDQVAFASDRGRALFRAALEAGTMEGYFRIAQQFHTQAEPAWCGLSTLVVVLNALDIDPGRLWKGPWRWYSEELLDCCVPLEQVKQRGVTLDELACLARCNGVEAHIHRPDEGAALEALRDDLLAASTAPAGPVVVAGYNRAALGQTGQGHFSPLGGYEGREDRALLLDVARFKYPPHWIELRALYDAMQAPDPDTGRSRGWVVLRRGQALPTLRFVLSCRAVGWTGVRALLTEHLPRALADGAPDTLDAAATIFLGALARGGLQIEQRAPVDDEHGQRVTTLRAALTRTQAYALAAAAAPHLAPEGGALLLLAAPDMLDLTSLPARVRDAWFALGNDIAEPVAIELAAIVRQLDGVVHAGAAPGSS